jgi:FHS family L-fucose permease-like MFS transporter
MNIMGELENGGPSCLADPGITLDRAEPPSYTVPLMALGLLYFTFGFITCLNDILVPHLKAVFDLDYTRAMLIQMSFFSAYFVMSLPSGWLVDRIGYQKGMVLGLATMACACLLFFPAAASRVYAVFLAALFLLASGITLLQVAANPYVAALGRPETASSRLTLTQGFNSLGTTLAPLFGSVLILSGAAQGRHGLGALGAGAERLRGAEAASVQAPYLGLAAALVALAAFTAWFRMPGAGPRAAGPGPGAQPSPWKHRPMLLGGIGIFLYVGAEVGIGSFLVNYISQLGLGGSSLARSALYVSFYWGGAMAGRFLGSAVMRRVPPGRVLAFNALAATALVLTAIFCTGPAAMVAILAVGFFNSIMFPTIFTLAIKDLGQNMGRASGILCMAVVGGAVVPVLQGLMADLGGIRMAFVLPVLCYGYIAFYGALGHAPGASPSNPLRRSGA